MGRVRGRTGALTAALALGAAWAALVPATAQAACGGLWANLGLQSECPPPPTSSTFPDPGGVESPDQPLPAPGKRLGFSSSVYISGEGSAARELDSVRQLGANVHRSTIQWKLLQPWRAHPLPSASAPAPDGTLLDRIDEFYAAALARGITPIFVVGWAPVWATKYRNCSWLDIECVRIADSEHNLSPDAEHIGHFRTYVAAVKARWPRALIEAWNEPDAFWAHPNYTGSRAFAASPEHFKAIQCAAYDASKSVNADPVLSAAWAMERDTYARRVYAAGGARCWDIANFHPYPGTQTAFGAGSSIAYVFDLFRRARRDYGDTDPIWVTETGYTTTGTDPVTESVQAASSRRLYNRLVTMSDVGAVLFHTLRDAPFPTAPYSSPSAPEYGYGFFRRDWNPKPVFCEFATTC